MRLTGALSGFSSQLVVMGICMLGLGCSQSQSEREGIYPVRGFVMVNGEPAEYANVILVPADPSSGLPKAYGVVAADGEFRLSTKFEDDGAKPGEYFVTISWTKPINPNKSEPDYGPELLPQKFQNPTESGLKVLIEAKSNELEPFAIVN